MEVYLVRHTTPTVRREICYGQTDLQVDTSLFEHELKRLRAHLPKRINAVYSSPLMRCTHLAARLGKSFNIDKKLLELNFGLWEMRPWNEIPDQQLADWMKDYVNYKVPGGESMSCLIKRAELFLDQLNKQPYEKVVIVSHAGVIRSLVGLSLKMKPENFFSLSIDYGSISLLQTHDTHVQLKFLNRT